MLPVKLPKMEKLEPTGNPLDKDLNWKKSKSMERNLQEKLILLILL